MTTYIANGAKPSLSLRAIVGGKLAEAGSSLAARQAKGTTRTRLQTLIRFVWHVAGFVALTQAAFSWNITAGWVMIGVSCFAMSTLTTKTPAVSDDEESTGRG